MVNLICRFYREQKALYAATIKIANHRKSREKNIVTNPDVEDDQPSESDKKFRTQLNEEFITNFKKTFLDFKVCLKNMELNKMNPDSMQFSATFLRSLSEFSFRVDFNSFYTTPKNK